MPPKPAGSLIDALTLRWRDTNIYLDEMSSRDGRKYLLVTVAGAGAVGLTMDGTTAKWIIYGEDAQKSDVFVYTIYGGAARNAIANDTRESYGANHESTPDSQK